jgi:putative hydrolase of the HAD superfamily
MPEQEYPTSARVIVFDIGNVLVTLDPLRTIANLKRLFQHEADVARALQWLESRDARYELGLITTDAFIQTARQALGLDREQIISLWSNLFTDRPSLLPFLQELSTQGYILALCSNTNELHRQYLQSHYSWFSLMSHQIFSYQVHVQKPDLAIYRAVEAATGHPAGEHLLIDDLPENVAGARAAGWDAICFQTPEQVQRELRAKGFRFTLWALDGN